MQHDNRQPTPQRGMLKPKHAEILKNIDATDEQKQAFIEVLESVCHRVLDEVWTACKRISDQ